MVLWAAIFVAGIFWLGFSGKTCRAAALSAPEGLLASGVNDSVVLSWEPVKGADGYEVYEKADGQDSWTMVKATAKKKAILSDRKSGTRYIYRVRAYKVKKTKIKYGVYSKKKRYHGTCTGDHNPAEFPESFSGSGGIHHVHLGRRMEQSG